MMHTARISWKWHETAVRGRAYFSPSHIWIFDNGVITRVSGEPVCDSDDKNRGAGSAAARIAAIASRHMLSFLSVASQAGYEPIHYTDCATGVCTPDDCGRFSVQSVTLRPQVIWAADCFVDVGEIHCLHQQAQEHSLVDQLIKDVLTIDLSQLESAAVTLCLNGD